MTFVYMGSELVDLFAQAKNWKTYVRRQVARYFGNEVLEVGAGDGGTTRVFCDGSAGAGSASSPTARWPTR